MSGLRKVVLHPSLIRPILLGGAERTLALLNGVIAAGLIFGIGSWQAATLGVVFAVGVHWGLVQLAKKDTQFFDIYKRHITYQDYYPAQAANSAPAPIIKYFHV
jgi:type IV secretory pathway TrbD component